MAEVLNQNAPESLVAATTQSSEDIAPQASTRSASAEFDIKGGSGTCKIYFPLTKGPGQTIKCIFSAPGIPNATFKFNLLEGQMVMEDMTETSGTVGIVVVNKDSLTTKKGTLYVQFYKEEKDMMGYYEGPASRIGELPEFSFTGWSYWVPR